jgi:hypothetical protein
MSRNIIRKSLLVSCIIIFLFFLSSAFAAWITKWFSFDKKDALTEWEEKIFKGRVLYSVKVEKTGGYLTAYSRNSASKKCLTNYFFIL